MGELDERINSLIDNIEKEFYAKKKEITDKLAVIEKKKRDEREKVRSDILLLKKDEAGLKAKLKELTADLETINSRLAKLKKQKLTDERKIQELAKIKKEYPKVVKDLTLYKEEHQELVKEKRQALYKTITDIIVDDGPLAILYAQMYQYGVRSEVSHLIEDPSIIWIPFPQLKKSIPK